MFLTILFPFTMVVLLAIYYKKQIVFIKNKLCCCCLDSQYKIVKILFSIMVVLNFIFFELFGLLVAFICWIPYATIIFIRLCKNEITL